MVVRFMLLVMSFVVGVSCLAIENGNENFDPSAEKPPIHIGGIKAIVEETPPGLLVTVYGQKGKFLCHVPVNDVVNSAVTFAAKQLPKKAVVIGLQRNENGECRVVRAVCLNIKSRSARDPQTGERILNAETGKFLKVSEDEQWQSVVEYYSQFKQQPSRFVRDKYGKAEFCQEAAAKKILVPDGQ